MPDSVPVAAYSKLQTNALTDAFYAAYVQAGASDTDLHKAGYFVDELPCPAQNHPCWNVSIPTTPTGKLQTQLSNLLAHARTPHKPVVLLSTGSYSPIHEGHLLMMDRARERLEADGYTVLAGYLSPSHDRYVSRKQNGQAALHCEHRIALLEEAVADSDWLSVCPWESRYAPTSLNFTDVVQRLQQYLHFQLPQLPAFEVAYVFGADNVAFFHAFEGEGLAVCVTRPPIPTPAIPAQYAKRWFVAQLAAASSSSEIRAGNLDLMAAATRSRYEALRWPAPVTIPPAAPLYLIRGDTSYGVKDWATIPIHAIVDFEKELHQILSAALVISEDRPEVQELSLIAQQALQENLTVESATPLLSLDACLPAPASLAISRQFELSGGQVFSKVQGPRPGHSPITEQLTHLAAENSHITAWHVLDDDTASGTTERAVSQLLNSAGYAITKFSYLNQLLLAKLGKQTSPIHDIVDARDFLLGATDAGLVVKLPNGQTGRVPYMLPFVNLVFRAKLPAPSIYAVSVALWDLNHQWLLKNAPALTVADASTGAQAFLLSAGFTLDTRLASIAKQMRDWLKSCQQLSYRLEA